jgi:phytoene desaturase
MNETTQCSIVGAGIAGVAAAIRLRAAGASVTVFDQNNYVGGKLAECSMQGYRFDMGPSLFTMPQFIEELFACAGAKMEDYFSYQQEEIICKYFFEDSTVFTAYSDKTKYIAEACRVFDVEPEALITYFDKSAMKYDRTRSIFLERSLHRWSTYLRRDTLKGLMAMPKLDLLQSLHQINRKAFRDPRLVQIFDRYATYNGSTPYRTPGIMSLIPHLEQNIGTYYPHGGMISIPRALHRLAEDMGVQFRLNTKVDQIMTEGNKVTGVRVGSSVAAADRVICNADMFSAYRYLLPQVKAPEKAMQQERSSSGIIFYWGVKKAFPSLQLHNIFFASDYRKEFDWISEGGEWHQDPTIYLNITSKCDTHDAPEGCENWFILINVPARAGEDWKHWTEVMRKAVIDKLSRLLKEDIANLIECEDVLTPDLIESRTSSHLGALYGSASNDRMAAFVRHPNFHADIQGLYFCGGSVHPGGGIPLCLLSGKIVAQEITQTA